MSAADRIHDITAEERRGQGASPRVARDGVSEAEVDLIMLENLDSIAWSQLTHAYEAATDVPAQIRNLTSANQGEREIALWELYGNIFHQGSRYQATPYAVQFLYELIAAPETPDRYEILYLLVNLALGYEESYLPDGLDVANFRGALKETDSQMSLTDSTGCRIHKSP
jgi:hypothetical protein